MLYFREKEQQRLFRFFDSASMKAMAIYGRRRTGKTELILDSIKNLLQYIIQDTTSYMMVQLSILKTI